MNCGVATFAMSSLEKILEYGTNLHCHVIILKPEPYLFKGEEAEKQNETEILEKFYKKCGFRKVQNTKYMVRRLG